MGKRHFIANHFNKVPFNSAVFFFPCECSPSFFDAPGELDIIAIGGGKKNHNTSRTTIKYEALRY
jgi:hypothetical protein